jgi:hypothetical protein
MASSWKPLHENHAIDVMALALVFREPLPTPLLKRTLIEAEKQALAAGLGSAQPNNTYEFKLGQSVTPVAKAGTMFNAYFEPDGDSAVPDAIAEQLQVDSHAIIYRTWSYVSWKDRIRTLLEPVIPDLLSVVGLSNARLEYRDRFYFDGPIEDVDNSALFQRGTRYIVPNVFDEKNEWHSHTGNFIESDAISRKLLQIAINAADDELEGNMKKRWVDVMTARDNRYQPDVEVSSEAVFNDMDVAHDELITTMSELLTNDVATRIYLKG